MIRRRRRKKGSLFKRIGAVARTSAVLGGAYALGRRNGAPKTANANTPKSPASPRPTSSALATRKGNNVSSSTWSKRQRNSVKVRRRLEALGGTASVLKNRKGRNANEINTIRSLQRNVGRRNAKKANRLRASGNYFSRQIASSKRLKNSSVANFNRRSYQSRIDRYRQQIRFF